MAGLSRSIEVKLREQYQLRDGDVVEVEVAD
jgi:CTP-dependent riboflavin kinase